MSCQLHNIIKASRPAIIAGPCAAESREQVLQTAEALKDIPSLLAFRAGLWKPRTKPGDFEGVGEQGLEWLKEVKEKTGIRLAVEIATARHAELCIEAGVDIVWIGARTVVSPFVVDEIANALKGNDVCIMVKNPVNPDISLWAGGLERLMKKGLKNLAAVHRGFDVYFSKPYRNLPLWEIPLELKLQYPDIPFLCDPSHIGGQREYLSAISQKALDLGMDGLMIETHIHPETALTDISQQVSPRELKEMLGNLIIRENQAESDSTLEKYRTTIDELDEQLLEILARRMNISEQIGILKKEQNLAPFQADRWQALLDDRNKKGEKLKLNSDFIKKVFEAIHMESIKRQE
ncbi:MAG: chorismate mutase [Bacteroidales bacterium]|nr:chorismate mutase [Bacteroidales bacterium]